MKAKKLYQKIELKHRQFKQNQTLRLEMNKN